MYNRSRLKKNMKINAKVKTNKLIVSDPNILSGTPVVKGTRVPVDRILYLFVEGFTIEEIQQQYSQIDMDTMSALIKEISQLVAASKHDTKTT